jgi:hypothetical protein
LAGSSVAAALELELPAPARDEAEAVARGSLGGDAPARHRDAGHSGRAQQQKEAAGFSSGDMQSLARSEIELSDHARDGGRHAGAQRLFHRPERLRGVGGRDQNHAGGIKAKAVEAMTIRTAKRGEAAGRSDEEEWRAGANPAQRRRYETEGCGDVPSRLRDDFVQGASGKAALRQVAIDGRQAEGQGACLGGDALLGQQAT